MKRLAVVPVALLLLAGCGGGDATGGADDRPTTTTAATAPDTGDDGDDDDDGLALQRVGEAEQPVAMAVDPAGVVHIAEKTGRVRRVIDDELRREAVVDLSGEVSTGSEQGLLGIAFAPDGRLFVNFTDREGDTRVEEVEVGSGARRLVLRVDQPYANHNGGQLAFGPDGHLYVGLGDGGSAGDPQGNGQKLSTRLGKILRVDPRPSGGRAFTVPPGNPFAGRDGADPLVWHFGLRNPWRFSFDRSTGEMWIADVGQGDWEEVDRAPAGAGGLNFGWNRREGSHAFRGGDAPPGAIDPVHEYGHDGGGCSITGGHVYRGRALPELQGSYVFADFCLGEIQAFGPDGTVTDLGVGVAALSSFGEDADGELWVLSLEGPVHRLVAA